MKQRRCVNHYETRKYKKNKKTQNRNSGITKLDSSSQERSVPQNKSKEFYSYLKSKRVITLTIGSLITENGRQMENETDMSNTLKDYFSAIEDVQGGVLIAAPQTHDTTLTGFMVSEN